MLTRIFQEPISDHTITQSLNLEGNKQANFTVHGGIDKAIYIYPYINHLAKKELNYAEYYA